MEKQDEMIQFSMDIENIVEDKDVSYIDAIILYCQERDLEVEVAATLCSDALKSKIQFEAEGLNCLPKSNTSRLPL